MGDKFSRIGSQAYAYINCTVHVNTWQDPADMMFDN